jgi:hypothetical protein
MLYVLQKQNATNIYILSTKIWNKNAFSQIFKFFEDVSKLFKIFVSRPRYFDFLWFPDVGCLHVVRIKAF